MPREEGGGRFAGLCAVGTDAPGHSFVWLPSLKAVVTGDIVFDHVYFGVPRPEPRANWQKTIDWDANVPRSKDAAQMRANVLEQYPGLGMEFTLNDRTATYFPAQPAAGKKGTLTAARRRTRFRSGEAVWYLGQAGHTHRGRLL